MDVLYVAKGTVLKSSKRYNIQNFALLNYFKTPE